MVDVGFKRRLPRPRAHCVPAPLEGTGGGCRIEQQTELSSSTGTGVRTCPPPPEGTPGLTAVSCCLGLPNGVLIWGTVEPRDSRVHQSLCERRDRPPANL